MTEPEEFEDDLFSDLYDGDTGGSNKAAPTISRRDEAAAAPLEHAGQSVSTASAPSQLQASSAAPEGHNHSQGDMAELGQTEADKAQDEAHGNDGDAFAPIDSHNHGDDAHVLDWGNGHQGHQSHQDHQQHRHHHQNQNHPSTTTEYEQEENVTDIERHNIGIKEDGKMFIGGLNWETNDQSLKEYFSQFGEVVECTVMRDGTTGRSRGFGFLTFKDPKTVNTVMVKEHYLDGKIIDPKRAIPRDEQEKTSKIFVGGVSQEATEHDFKSFFTQFGRVVDATLMIDKDTGRPRGFGFVTFDNESAVEATLSQPLAILGKPIEVKKAQPRGSYRDTDDDRGGDRRFHRRGGRDGGYDRHDRDGGSRQYGGGGGGGNYDDHQHDKHGSSQHQLQQHQHQHLHQHQHQHQQQQQQHQQQQQLGQNPYGNMTPQMMAQYWQRMQQYFALMQQQMATAATQGRGVTMPAVNIAAAGMNPALLQQMAALQAVNRTQVSPTQPNMPGAVAQGIAGINPALLQQFQQMQQLQLAQQQQQQQAGFVGATATAAVAAGGAIAPGMGVGAAGGAGGGMPGAFGSAGGGAGVGRGGGPGYNAYEQQLFEQRKYEQQQSRRVGGGRDQQQMYGQFQGGAPTSWEGMYDDVPQPNMGMPPHGMSPHHHHQGFPRQMTPNQGHGGGPGGGNRGYHNRGSQGSPSQVPPSAPPANAPTGPKNAGKPGANYRGGGRVSGSRGFHPYARPQ